MNEKPPPKSHPPRSPFLRKGEEERMLRGAITPSAERGKKSGCFAERSSLPQEGGRRADASRSDHPFRRKGEEERALHVRLPLPQERVAARATRHVRRGMRCRTKSHPRKSHPPRRAARAFAIAPPFLRKGEEERTLRFALPAERGRKRTPLGHGGIFGRPVRQPAVTIIHRAGH